MYAIEVTAFQKAGTVAPPAMSILATPRLALTQLAAFIADTTAIIRASDTGYRTLESDDDGLQVYPPLVNQAFAITREINLDPAESQIGFAYGSLTLANPDGQFDAFAADWNSDGRPVRILFGAKTYDATRGYYTDPSYADLSVAFTGMATPWFLSDTELQIPLRDATYWLDRNLQTNVYAGNGTYEGTSDLAGKPKPKARGGTISAPIRNVLPLLIDPVEQIYQYTDGPGSIVNLYEGGAITFVFDSDTSDLYSGTTPSGKYRTDDSRGLFQLGTIPTSGRAMTADITGEFPIAGAITQLGLIARYLMTEEANLPAENIDTVSFDIPLPPATFLDRSRLSRPHLALSLTASPVISVNPLGAIAGVWFASDDIVDGVTAVNRVLSSAGAQLIGTRAGKLRLIRLTALDVTAMPALALSPSNCVSVIPAQLPAGVSPPPFRFRVGYSHNHTVQSSGVSPSATGAWAQFIAAAERYAISSNTDILLKYRRPNDTRPVGFGALLQSGVAKTVVDDLLDLWSTRRRVYNVTVPLSIGLTLDFAEDAQRIVRLTWPMDDLRDGRLGQIVGETFRSQDNTIVWKVLV